MLRIIASLLGHAADSPTLSHFPLSSVPDREELVLTGTRTHGSVPTLRPAFAVWVRVIPWVRVQVAHLRAMGLPVLLPNCVQELVQAWKTCLMRP